MKKRKTITFPQLIYEIGHVMQNHDRLLFYDTLMNHFLGGIPMDTNNLPENVKLAVIWASPKIREMESKFNNGSSPKKFENRTKALFCPENESGMKQNEAEKSGSDSRTSDYNLHIVTNNIYSNSNQTKESCAPARETFKTTNDDELACLMNKLEVQNPNQYKTMSAVLNHVQRNKTIKIRGNPINNNEVQHCIIHIMKQPNFSTLLESAINEATAPAVGDQISYLTSVLYNLSHKLVTKPQTQSTPRNYEQRTYTPEQMNQLFDNLEEEIT